NYRFLLSRLSFQHPYIGFSLQKAIWVSFFFLPIWNVQGFGFAYLGFWLIKSPS
ncbi:hypothetical protein PanWU01x14_291140, partial [Parasponia andersonii]